MRRQGDKMYFPGLFFTVDIAHSHDLAACLRHHGIKVYPLSGETPDDERARLIRLYSEGAIDGLASCGVLQRGFDAPNAMFGAMCNPTKSGSRYRQQCGRVTRLYPGREGRRQYQADALNAVYRELLAGVNLQLVCMATGTGKTYCAARIPDLIKHWCDKTGRKPRGRHLFLANRKELVTQAADTFRKFQPELTVGIEQADRYAGDADVVIASVDTLGRAPAGEDGGEFNKRLRDLNPLTFDDVIVDEADLAVQHEHFLRILRYMRVLKGAEIDIHKLLLCITATPNRSDNVGMEKIVDKISYSYDLRDAISDGWLAPLRSFRVETSVDISKVGTRNGDFVTGELEETVNTPARNELIAQEYLRIRDLLKADLHESIKDYTKPYCVIADFVDVTGHHQLVTTPTIFGLRKNYNAQGGQIVEQADEIEKLEERNPGLDLREYPTLDKIKVALTQVDLLAPPEIPPEIRKVSRFTWLREGDGMYHLGLLDGSLITIRENTLGQFEVARHHMGSRRVLWVAKSLKEAVERGDQQVPEDEAHVLKAAASWRKEPPAEKQVRLLFTLDRNLKAQFGTAQKFYEFALQRHHGGDLAFSRGGLSRRIDSVRAARR